MASGSKESPSNNPGLHTSPDEATKDYLMQQTMYRVKDPKVSLDFYSRILGMSLAFVILAGLTFVGALASMILVVRTREFYKGDIYKKFREGGEEGGREMDDLQVKEKAVEDEEGGHGK